MKSSQKQKLFNGCLGVLLAIIMIIGVLPVNSVAAKAADTSAVTVSTPKQLAKALESGAEQVTLKTEKSGRLTIQASASNSTAELIIDTPNAKIINKATFGEINIKSCKSYSEKASGNNLYIYTKKTKIDVSNNVSSSLSIKKNNAKIILTAHDHSAVNVYITKKSRINVKGSKHAEVKIASKYKGASITSSIPVSVTANKSVSLTLNPGSEGTIIDLESADTDIIIVNNSDKEPGIRYIGEVTAYPTPSPEVTTVTSYENNNNNGVTTSPTAETCQDYGTTVPLNNDIPRNITTPSITNTPTETPADSAIVYNSIDTDYINALSDFFHEDKSISVSTASLSAAHTKRVIVKGEPDWGNYKPEKVIKTPYGEYIIQFSDTTSAQSFIEAQKNNPNVEYAEEDKYLFAGYTTGNNSNSSSTIGSWGTDYIEAGILSDWIMTNLQPRETLVAVVDTGISYDHSFLQGYISSNGYDIIDGDSDPTDNYNGHGTHVSGTIVDCAYGLPVKILPVRVLDYDGYGTDLSVATGIRYSVSKGAKVINLSLGGGHSCIIDSAINEAVASGTIVCVAAGNESSNTAYSCPAHLQNCIVVSALEDDESIAYFSNYGTSVDIAAPGVSVLSCVPGNSYESWDGTSMATPHVSAAAAMISMIHPEYSPAEVESFLTSCTKDLGITGKDDYYGYGALNLSLATPIISAVSLSVEQLPSKTEYYLGETLDYTGLMLEITFSDGHRESITTGFTCSPTVLNSVGIQHVTVYYEDLSCEFTVNVIENTVTSISISSLPTRLEYYDGETLDTTGLTLKKTYADGQEETISSGFSCSPMDLYLSDAIQSKGYSEKRTITVIYENFSDTFDITLKALSIDEIYFSSKPAKTSYYIGASPDTTGMVLGIKYNDGSEAFVTDGFVVSPSTFTVSGNQAVTISYAGKTISYNVTVAEKQVSHIKVETLPYKTEYSLSETFDPDGLTISLNYEDGTSEIISTGFTYVTPEWKPGETKITVLYGSLATVFNITIKNERQLSDWTPIADVPTGSEIAEKKWTYDLTETTTSENDSLSGWTLTGSEWKLKDSGIVSYATFPSTFDTSSEVYSILSKEPLQEYESSDTKRTVTNSFGGWVYWHWMYNVPFANNTARMISDRTGNWDQYGNSGSGFWFGYFSAFISSVDAPYLSNKYCCSRNQAGYNCIDIMPDKSSLGTGTPRYFRFEFYNSEYTDYSKVYLFTKISHLESSTEVLAGNGISNIQCLVRYYK